MKRPESAVILARMMCRLTNTLALGLRPRARIRALSYLMESLDPRFTAGSKYGPIHFYCPATWPYSRSDMRKEPVTYEWIESFAEGDVFWDIGANVGVYSLYAAKRGHKVVAFEPAAMNYFVLAKNVELNGLDNQIVFLNVALHDKSGLDILHMPHTQIGGAQHSFGVPQSRLRRHEASSPTIAFKQSTLGFAIDDFIAKYPVAFPNHIKIDVDGNEDRVIIGARETLKDRRLKSLQIEIRPDERRDFISDTLAEADFKLMSVAGMNHIFANTQR